jgi:maltose O-acetyltransferase
VRAGLTLAGAPPRVVPRESVSLVDEGERPHPTLRPTLAAVATMGRDELAGVLPSAERVLRLFDNARAHALLRGFELGRRVYVRGRLDVKLEGRASIGDRTMLMGGPVPTTLRVRRGGQLSIGEGCQINYGVTFDATSAVRVGARCMFGSYARLVDDGRPIVLEDDVWVAHGATILPGVTIGRGAVIGAGAVVTGDVGPGMLAVGNPARQMSQAMSGN